MQFPIKLIFRENLCEENFSSSGSKTTTSFCVSADISSRSFSSGREKSFPLSSLFFSRDFKFQILENTEMSNHMVVYVDGLVRPVSLPPVLAEDNVIDIYDGDTTTTEEEEDSLISSAECRICQDECAIKNLESPCACNGSLKYAHRKCVQRWCNEKGNTICEICHQPYQAGYTSPPPPPQSEETTIDIGGGWRISGLDLNDPRLLAIAEAERQILESEYDDYTASDTSGAAFFRSAALILMTLLLLRHALTIPDYADDPSSILSLFLLRAASFLLPCYIMASAISILHRRRQRQEAADLATRFALVLSSRQPRAVINYLSMEP